MPLTPADIHNVAFKKPPLGKRGYDEEEVDAFLDEVEQQLIRLMEENDDLRGRIHRPGSAPVPSPMSSSLDAERSAIAAQLQRAEQERARAEQHARGLQAQLESAPAERPSFNAGVPAVMMMAQRTADDHLEDARRESEAMLDAARDQSAQITTEAQRKADNTEGDARRRHAEAINSLEMERAAVLDEIDRLARLAESYQSALREHVEAQLSYMESAPEPAAGR